MASHLTALFHSEGLVDVTNHPSDELVRRGDPDFLDAYASGIWLYVIQTLGPDLVQAGFLEEMYDFVPMRTTAFMFAMRSGYKDIRC